MSMPLLMPRPMRIQCPNCGAPLTVKLHTIVDGGRQPELKEQLLEGRLNAVVCPACQHRGVMAAPLLYHDGGKEFLGVFIPQQSGMGETERQKVIGELTSTLMNSLPPQERKGYLFQAKQFLTLPSLMDAIVIADGVTPEQLQKQRDQLRLMQRLLDALSDEGVLKAIVAENDQNLGYEFFVMLTSLAERARDDGQQAQASQMLALRERLLGMTSWGKEAKTERDVLEHLGGVRNVDELIDKLLGVADDDLEEVVRVARPLLDYGFFQALTARMDKAGKEADKEQAKRLRALRARLLQLTEQLDKEMQQKAERATNLLRKLLESDDPRALAQERRSEIDDMLLAVLSMNLQQAERTGATNATARLRRVWQVITEVLEESMPPEIRFINRLLEAEFPNGTQALLKEQREQVNDRLLETMQAIADDLAGQGNEEMAKRLRDIRGQAVLMV